MDHSKVGTRGYLDLTEYTTIRKYFQNDEEVALVALVQMLSLHRTNPPRFECTSDKLTITIILRDENQRSEMDHVP
jgi:hypothetical protein